MACRQRGGALRQPRTCGAAYRTDPLRNGMGTRGSRGCGPGSAPRRVGNHPTGNAASGRRGPARRRDGRGPLTARAQRRRGCAFLAAMSILLIPISKSRGASFYDSPSAILKSLRQGLTLNIKERKDQPGPDLQCRAAFRLRATATSRRRRF